MLKANSKFIMFQSIKRVLICAIYLFTLNAYANNGFELDSENSQQWYQIDFVIFEHLKTDKHILRYEDIPYPKIEDKQYNYLTSNSDPVSPYQFSLLEKEKSVLADAIKKLRRSRLVSVLDTGSWQQTLSEDTLPAPLRINKVLAEDRSLFGEVQLKKSRFTHAEFKLYLGNSYSVPYKNISDWLVTNTASWHVIDLLKPLSETQKAEQTESSLIYTNLVYLNESRRIKDGEIHYIDHPALSVIVTIKEVSEPESLNNYLSYRYE